MALADLSIDEAQATVWVMDVQHELSAVRALLGQVREAITTTPGDGDSIYENVTKVAQVMEDVWTRMCNGFDKVSEFIQGAIRETVKAGQKVVEAAGELKGQIKG